LALATDYDCWYDQAEEVSVEGVVATLLANVALARKTIVELARLLPQRADELPYPRACEAAVMTSKDAMPPRARARLDLIIGHYL
jgi:5'-methylthioadenosine phosphorylase